MNASFACSLFHVQLPALGHLHAPVVLVRFVLLGPLARKQRLLERLFSITGREESIEIETYRCLTHFKRLLLLTTTTTTCRLLERCDSNDRARAPEYQLLLAAFFAPPIHELPCSFGRSLFPANSISNPFPITGSNFGWELILPEPQPRARVPLLFEAIARLYRRWATAK